MYITGACSEYIYTVYLEIIMVTNFRVKKIVGQRHPRKFIYTKIILHILHVHMVLLLYTMASVIEHVHRRACCVWGYHVYCEIWEAAVGGLYTCL